MKHSRIASFILLLAAAMIAANCEKEESIIDDAGGRQPEDLAEIAADVFAEMDAPLKFDPNDPEDAKAIKGRNTWNLWTAGNEQFWDRMARESYGLIDLLKTIDSRNRGNRFKEMGLINQPGMREATEPDEFGLWIDEVVEPESEAIDPEVYGRPTGIMGFRLFPNPAFDEKARKGWDANRYYNDSDYAANPKLVRPYVVGISCGSCHISHHPLRPPDDPENPEWRNLSSTIGNQYIHEGRTFANNVEPGGFFWEMVNTQPRGTSDTSRIATDNINNPNAINSIFLLAERESIGHQETSSGETLLLPGEEPDESPELRVLKDGADSVGVVGAALRVYVNIGEFSQHWLQQINPLIGLTDQKPFSVKKAQQDSVFWRATEQKVSNIAAFFRRVKPYKLADAEGGAAFMPTDQAALDRGRVIFARNCATCHSSRQPPRDVEDTGAWFEQESANPKFWEDNFLSNEVRYPVTRIKTNAARAAATNAMRNHIWHFFSSEDYKNLPSAGDIDVWNPYTEKDQKFHIQGGGPGYYRTTSLVSVWATAPLLHNNALGLYNNDPSVKGRIEAFDDAIEKLLWPGKRLGRGSIWRTSRECQIQIRGAVIPEPLRKFLKPRLDCDGYFRIGHIPEGTPVNLLANIDPSDPMKITDVAIKIKKALKKINEQKLNSAGAKELLRTEVAPALFEISKCPDLIEDRGHCFGTELPDEDKWALISFLKTL